jgi:hypothetical protein
LLRKRQREAAANFHKPDPMCTAAPCSPPPPHAPLLLTSLPQVAANGQLRIRAGFSVDAGGISVNTGGVTTQSGLQVTGGGLGVVGDTAVRKPVHALFMCHRTLTHHLPAHFIVPHAWVPVVAGVDSDR